MNERAARTLRLRHVFAIGTGAMFSSGFFLLPGLVADETGPSAPLAYLVAGLLVLPTMLSVAELATAMPRAGGPYHFLMRSLGPQAAVVGALGLWLALVGKAAFALAGIDAYLRLLVDVPAVPLAVVLTALFTFLNVLGARESAGLQLGLVVVLLAVLGAFAAAGLTEVARAGPARTEPLTPLFSGGGLGFVAAIGMVFIAFAGIPQVASVAGVVRDPTRSIPRGILASLAVGTVVYVVGTALMVLTLSPAALRDDLTPVATAVGRFPLPAGEVLVVVAALAAFASTGNAGILSAARYPLALARDRFLWGRFARLNRSGAPGLSVVVTGVAVAGVVLVLDTEQIATYGSALILSAFALFNLAVLVLRRGRTPGYRPTFRAPLHPWSPLLGLLVPVPLILDLGTGPVVFVAAVAGLGTTWEVAVARRRRVGPGARR